MARGDGVSGGAATVIPVPKEDGTFLTMSTNPITGAACLRMTVRVDESYGYVEFSAADFLQLCQEAKPGLLIRADYEARKQREREVKK